MIRSLMVLRVLVPLLAGAALSEARRRFPLWLRYQRARWLTGCGRHQATAQVRPRLLVPLSSFCDLPQTPPWPSSMPQRPSGGGWGAMPSWRSPIYVFAPRKVTT